MLLAGMFFKIFTLSDMTEVQLFILMIQNQTDCLKTKFSNFTHALTQTLYGTGFCSVLNVTMSHIYFELIFFVIEHKLLINLSIE